MKNKQTLTIAALVIALAILATFGIFRNPQGVQAQDTTPPSLTHLNVPEKNVVNLHGFTSNLREVRRDGSVSSVDYTVPRGMVFVVTDVVANVEGLNRVPIMVNLKLLILPNDDTTSRSIFEFQFTTDKHGLGTVKDHFSGGLMVGPGNKLKFDPEPFMDVKSSVLGYTVPLTEMPQ
jgi:hypothetical protein